MTGFPSERRNWSVKKCNRMGVDRFWTGLGIPPRTLGRVNSPRSLSPNFRVQCHYEKMYEISVLSNIASVWSSAKPWLQPFFDFSLALFVGGRSLIFVQMRCIPIDPRLLHSFRLTGIGPKVGGLPGSSLIHPFSVTLPMKHVLELQFYCRRCLLALAHFEWFLFGLTTCQRLLATHLEENWCWFLTMHNAAFRSILGRFFNYASLLLCNYELCQCWLLLDRIHVFQDTYFGNGHGRRRLLHSWDLSSFLRRQIHCRTVCRQNCEISSMLSIPHEIWLLPGPTHFRKK